MLGTFRFPLKINILQLNFTVKIDSFLFTFGFWKYLKDICFKFFGKSQNNVYACLILESFLFTFSFWYIFHLQKMWELLVFVHYNGEWTNSFTFQNFQVTGRSKKTRGKSPWEMKIENKCGRCDLFGHNRKTCRNSPTHAIVLAYFLFPFSFWKWFLHFYRHLSRIKNGFLLFC